LRVIFIRHGKTKGNIEKRYIGSTNEGLSDTGIYEIQCFKEKYPKSERIISSPMRRCIETTKIIYGDGFEIYDDLRECDFGDFENKNYNELKDNSEYLKWLESGGKTGFPGGEGYFEFRMRCVKCFEKVLLNNNAESVTFVTHGGTIMAILERFYYEKKSFFDWKIENGEYLEFEILENEDGIYLKDL
jgi:alpha-ribazole phosphatase